MRDAEETGSWPPEGLVRQPGASGLQGASGGLGADVGFKEDGWPQPVWTRQKPLYLERKEAGTAGRGSSSPCAVGIGEGREDRKSTRLNSSH